MAYLMQNGKNLGPVIEVTELPDISTESFNKHAVYRLMSLGDPFVVPPEYAPTYHGSALGRYGTGMVYAEREIEEDFYEDGFYKPVASATGIVFPDASEGWDRQNLWGDNTWEEVAAKMSTDYIFGAFTPGDLDDDDNEVPFEFSFYWDSIANAPACLYDAMPEAPRFLVGFYIFDGHNAWKQIDADVQEMEGATYELDGKGGSVPQPLTQRGFASLLSDGRWGFPEATTSTFYGTGGTISMDTPITFWGLTGKKYNDKSVGGYVSYDCPCRPMIYMKSGCQPKECFLHVDLQWNGTSFYVVETARPYVNGHSSAILLRRHGTFTKATDVNLTESHLSSATWEPWYFMNESGSFNTIISDPSSVDVLGKHKYASIGYKEAYMISNTALANFAFQTAEGVHIASNIRLVTDVLMDSQNLPGNKLTVRVKQTAYLFDSTTAKDTERYVRYGTSVTSGSVVDISTYWSSLTWDTNWVPDGGGSVMTGATPTAAGRQGEVPAPAATDNLNKALTNRGVFDYTDANVYHQNGTWSISNPLDSVLWKPATSRTYNRPETLEFSTEVALPIYGVAPVECVMTGTVMFGMCSDSTISMYDQIKIIQKCAFLNGVTFERVGTGTLTKLQTTLSITDIQGLTWGAWYQTGIPTYQKANSSSPTDSSLFSDFGGGLYHSSSYPKVVAESVCNGITITLPNGDNLSNCILKTVATYTSSGTTFEQTAQILNMPSGPYVSSVKVYRRTGGYFTTSSFSLGDAIASGSTKWTGWQGSGVVEVTKTQYDAISVKDPTTIYVVDMFN